MSKRQRVEYSCRLETLGIPVGRYVGVNLAEIRSIVPLGRGYFPLDSRHFVPGYYRAVPLGQIHPVQNKP
jgi:hypothetical protein